MPETDRLEALIVSRLPAGLPQFPDDQLTDLLMRFICAEIVREKLFRSLKQELPYSITVNIDHYVEEQDITRISATIWVERQSQKAIVIGTFSKSIVARSDLAEGTVLGPDDITLKKPGGGLPATKLPEVIGRRLKSVKYADAQLTDNDLE